VARKEKTKKISAPDLAARGLVGKGLIGEDVVEGGLFKVDSIEEGFGDDVSKEGYGEMEKWQDFAKKLTPVTK